MYSNILQILHVLPFFIILFLYLSSFLQLFFSKYKVKNSSPVKHIVSLFLASIGVSCGFVSHHTEFIFSSCYLCIGYGLVIGFVAFQMLVGKQTKVLV